MKLHLFMDDANSGAGNCLCGAPKRHMSHPHTFVKALYGDRCTCTLPKLAEVHDKPAEKKASV